jgi:hypothetical protein
MSIWRPARETPPDSPNSVGSCTGQRAGDLTSSCDICGDLRLSGSTDVITRRFDYSRGHKAAGAGCPFCDCLCRVVQHYFGFDISNDESSISRDRIIVMKLSTAGPMILTWKEYDVVIYTPHGTSDVLLRLVQSFLLSKVTKRSGRRLDTGVRHHQLQGLMNRSRQYLHGCPNVQRSIRTVNSLLLFVYPSELLTWQLRIES